MVSTVPVYTNDHIADVHELPNLSIARTYRYNIHVYPNSPLVIVIQVFVVNHEWSIHVHKVFVVEMKYLYHDNPAQPGSAPTACQVKLMVQLNVDQLIGLISVGVAQVVSSITVNILHVVVIPSVI